MIIVFKSKPIKNQSPSLNKFRKLSLKIFPYSAYLALESSRGKELKEGREDDPAYSTEG